jgi:uncharacterized Fe-S cluster-containing radical SAM superfamily enzyme
MSRDQAEPSGVLVLRAWVEGETLDGLRVRVIQVENSGETSTMIAGSIERTCRVVEGWLNELLRTGQVPLP